MDKNSQHFFSNEQMLLNNSYYIQALYKQVLVNSRTFQGFLKASPTVFKDLKLMKSTDRKCLNSTSKMLD